MSFVDLDLDESQLGGTIEWDPPLRTAAVSVPLSADLQKQFAQEDTVLASVLSIHLCLCLLVYLCVSLSMSTGTYRACTHAHMHPRGLRPPTRPPFG